MVCESNLETLLVESAQPNGIPLHTDPYHEWLVPFYQCRFVLRCRDGVLPLILHSVQAE